MIELKGDELRHFVKTATWEEILEYWKQVSAPKYGYKELRDGKTGKLIAKIASARGEDSK